MASGSKEWDSKKQYKNYEKILNKVMEDAKQKHGIAAGVLEIFGQ